MSQIHSTSSIRVFFKSFRVQKPLFLQKSSAKNSYKNPYFSTLQGSKPLFFPSEFTLTFSSPGIINNLTRLGTFSDFWESSRNKDKACHVLEKRVQERDIDNVLLGQVLILFQFLPLSFFTFYQLVVLIETLGVFHQNDLMRTKRLLPSPFFFSNWSVCYLWLEAQKTSILF